MRISLDARGCTEKRTDGAAGERWTSTTAAVKDQQDAAAPTTNKAADQG